MPSHRKRIGFLPSQEVHDIIEKICHDNNFSQSKLTGILVEEALNSRGILKNYLANKNVNHLFEKIDSKSIQINSIDNLKSNFDFPYINKKCGDDDLRMINDFIEYKFFKKIMNQNKKLIE